MRRALSGGTAWAVGAISPCVREAGRLRAWRAVNAASPSTRGKRSLRFGRAICHASIDGHSVGEEREKRAAARRQLTAPAFDKTLKQAGLDTLTSVASPTTLQINIGLTCNMACSHCHVESSPARKETMTRVVADRLLALCAADGSAITEVDITGGAPEMHREFRRLVRGFRRQGLPVIDRCNLSILQQPGQEDLVEFLAQQQVRVVASMPCYTPGNVEKQRGDGAFDASISGLQALNAAGYGVDGSGLELTLVYNPVGAQLPPEQRQLEEDYRRELRRAFGIEFTSLICITNLPVKRFADDLRRSGKLEEYMELLVSSFREENVAAVMCRSMVHVDHTGEIHDCDFNYALDIPLLRVPVDTGVSLSSLSSLSSSSLPPTPPPRSIFDLASWDELGGRRIATGAHCYGCTAGAGSSCGGSLNGPLNGSLNEPVA